MDTKNAYTISLSVRKIHIKLQPNAVVCITRTFFLHSALVWWLVVVGDSFFRVLLQLLFFSWNSALDFFSFHLHVCLICGLFCRNFFFYPPLNLFSLLKSLSPWRSGLTRFFALACPALSIYKYMKLFCSLLNSWSEYPMDSSSFFMVAPEVNFLQQHFTSQRTRKQHILNMMRVSDISDIYIFIYFMLTY